MRSSLNIEGAECKHDFGYKGYPYQQNSNLQGGVQVMCMQPWFFSMGRLHLGQGLLFARILFIIHKEYSLADIGHFILPHTCQPTKNMCTQNRTLNFGQKNHHIVQHKCMYNKKSSSTAPPWKISYQFIFSDSAQFFKTHLLTVSQSTGRCASSRHCHV